MAGASLIALLDDIATVLDDISVLTKVAAKKTAGVLGDDLALNAQQVSGVRAERELPVVWAVAKGSFKNKLILVPSALLLSAFLPQLIAPLLIIGGLYLCYEGFEKVWHLVAHKAAQEVRKRVIREQLLNPSGDLLSIERHKIKGAIRTDFILSAEIIVIALGSAANAPFMTQAMVVSLIALLMTVGVYGLVALIVKLDDIGLHLLSEPTDSLIGNIKRCTGRALLSFCPWLMKALSILGTTAMFLVGGGILVHGLPLLADLHLALTSDIVWVMLVSLLFQLLAGILAGALVLLLKNLLSYVKSPNKN